MKDTYSNKSQAFLTALETVENMANPQKKLVSFPVEKKNNEKKAYLKNSAQIIQMPKR